MMEGYITADIIDRYQLLEFNYDRSDHSGIFHLIDMEDKLPPIRTRIRDYSNFITSPEPIVWVECTDQKCMLSVQTIKQMEQKTEELFYKILKYIDPKIYNKRLCTKGRIQCERPPGY